MRIHTSKNRSAVFDIPIAKPRISETDIASMKAIDIRRNVTATWPQICPDHISSHSTSTTLCGGGMTVDGNRDAARYHKAISASTERALMT